MAARDSAKETLSVSALQEKLQTLGVGTPIPSFKGTDVLTNPVDIYRSYLADTLTRLIDCDAQLVYESIQWTNSLPNGDLVLVVPRLRLKGVKPADLAKDLSDKVRIVLSNTPSSVATIADYSALVVSVVTIVHSATRCWNSSSSALFTNYLTSSPLTLYLRTWSIVWQ